ncbi:MAG: tripartite tricarboxylate transporter substrate binding protein, partial [Oscillospiraceae bacterium]|nr:tripartite tricarboxylate transporter substrate binding protein [Oscillospiraceae bacterium]
PAAPAAPTEPAKEAWKPERAVEIIVPFAAGGGTDIMARVIAAELPFETVVTNMTGGNSSIGTMEAFHRDPNGETILCHVPNSLVNHSNNGVYGDKDVYQKFIPIGCPVLDPIILCINSKNEKFSDWDSLAEYIKANPADVKWGASGNKSGNHGACVKAANLMGVEKITYVPFDGTAKARTALLGDNIDVACGMISELGAYIESGDFKCIVVMADSRCSFIPDVPTFTELGGNPPPVPTRGFYAVPETPQEIVDALTEAIKTVSENPEVMEKMKTLWYDPFYTAPEKVSSDMTAYLDYLADFPRLFASQQ